MAAVSPNRSSSSLSRIMRVGSSGRKHSSMTHVHAIYARSPTKPKKLQSAHYDETTGTWRCKYCGWDYPTTEPHHHLRRHHKKICPGLQKVQSWLSHSSGRSSEEDTDSYDTSNVTYNPSTPETADTATTKFAAGQEEKKNGVNRLRHGDSAKPGDRGLAPRLLDREFKAYATPSSNELPRGIAIQEGGDARPDGGQKLSEQPGILALGDNSSGEFAGSESAKETLFKTLSDDTGREQILYGSDSSLSHQPSQDSFDKADFAGLLNSEFLPVFRKPSGGFEKGRDFGMKQPSSGSEGDGLRDGRLSSSSHERGLKGQAKDSREGFQHREPRMTTADNQKPSLPTVDNQEPSSTTAGNQHASLTTADKQKPSLTSAGKQHPSLTTANNQKPSMKTADNQHPSLATADNQKPSLATTDNQHPSLATADNQHPSLATADNHHPSLTAAEKQKPRSTTANNQAQVQKGSKDGFSADHNLPKEETELVPDGQEMELAETDSHLGSHPSREGMGEESGETDAMVRVTDEVLQDNEEDVMSEKDIPPNDQVGEDHASMRSAPNAVAGDGMDYKGGDDYQRGQFSSDVSDEAMQDAVGQGLSEHPEHPTGDDLHGHETERVGATPSGQLSTAKGVSETPTHGGEDELSRAQRNWDGWQDVVSGEDRVDEPNLLPLLEETDDGRQPFAVDSLTSQDQTGHHENDSAGKSADVQETVGVGLKSGEGADNETGAQLDGLDWESLLDKSVVTQPGESLSSTSAADHHLSSDQDGGELIQGLDQQDDGNVEEMATATPASQQLPSQTRKLPIKLSAAAANWDDWEDVINEVPMLIDEISSKKAEAPESSSGEHQASGVESLEGGDVSEPGQGKTGTVLESESIEDVVDTAPAELPVHTPENERSDWLIDFSEPSSVEDNSGTPTEVIPALTLSTPKVTTGPDFFDLLLVNEASGQEQGATSLDSIPAPQPEDGQITNVPSKLPSALRNREDWEDVVRERDGVSGAENTSPVLGSDLGIGEHHSALDSPSLLNTNNVEESDRPAGSVQASEAPPLAINPGEVVDSGQGDDGLDHEMQPDVTTASVPGDSDDLFRFPKPESVPNVSGNSSAEKQDFPDSVLGQRRKGVDNEEDTPPRESGQAVTESPPSAQRGSNNWADGHKNEHLSGGSRQSSPSFEDAHEGGSSSESEYPDDHQKILQVPLGKRRWGDWEDLANSEFMVLDGPGGESLIFKRTSDASGSPLSVKSQNARESPSVEDPDDDGGSPRLRRTRRQPPSLREDTGPSVGPLKGASPRGVVRFDYSAGPHSFQGADAPNSLPPISPTKAEAEGDRPSLVSTRRPLLYRDSRRDYTSEIEDMDITNEPQDQLVHHHDHSHPEHEDALNYDVVKVLRGQTKYDLICPICGAKITKKIVIRKKKRRFVSERDPRWRRSSEIAPAVEAGNDTPQSDASSDSEDASAAWKQGIRPCFGYFFGS